MTHRMFPGAEGGIAFVDESTGPPVLVLHGFTGSAATMSLICSKLSSSHRVIAPDLPGHGHSQAPVDVEPYTTKAIVSRLEGLLDHLELSAIDLVGYSLGGRLALSFAVHSPGRVRRIALVGTTAGIDDEAARASRRVADESLAAAIEVDGVEAFVDFWEELPIFATQRGLEAATRAEIRRGRLDNSAVGLANSLRGCGAGVMPHLWSSLHTLEQPILLVVGELDERYLLIGQQLVDGLPDAELYVVRDVGHAAHIEAPDLVGSVVSEFLGRS
jgi:2-succinyl-6-hydroxy-2,4-cyclohexadiene-1-carboxylate synthase